MPDRKSEGGNLTLSTDGTRGCARIATTAAAFALASALTLALTVSPAAAQASTGRPVYVFGIPVDFILFALTLIGVALFHHKTLQVALTGLAAIVLYKLIFTGFKYGGGLTGLALHLQHEAVVLSNLFLLLMGFALLSRHFENSRIPDEMPAFLPDDWQGGLALLAIVFVLSAFLDNIAAALIGGAMARHVFKRQGAHRLPRRHRRRLQRRRLRQRGRRHHHDDDVDRRHQPAVGAQGLRGGRRRLPRVRHSRRDPAASLFADREGRAARPEDRLAVARHRRGDPDRRDRSPTSPPT